MIPDADKPEGLRDFIDAVNDRSNKKQPDLFLHDPISKEGFGFPCSVCLNRKRLVKECEECRYF